MNILMQGFGGGVKGGIKQHKEGTEAEIWWTMLGPEPYRSLLEVQEKLGQEPFQVSKLRQGFWKKGRGRTRRQNLRRH